MFQFLLSKKHYLLHCNSRRVVELIDRYTLIERLLDIELLVRYSSKIHNPN